MYCCIKNYPAINAEIQNEEIVYKNYYNISFAVGTDRGLVVPVLRNPDEMSFAEIEKNILNLEKKQEMVKLQLKTYREELLLLQTEEFMVQCFQHQY